MNSATQAHKPRFSFEFFPAAPSKQTTFWRNVGQLETLGPSFFSVTQGALGTDKQKSLEVVKQLHLESRVPIAAHITSAGSHRATVDQWVEHLHQHGIRHLVALRGDAPHHPEGYADALSFIEALQKRYTFDISVAAYPETHPKARSTQADLAVLKAKLDAGAQRALSQFFFSAETFLRFRDQAVRAGIAAECLIPGILPIHDFQQVCSFSQRCGASVPKSLYELFEGSEGNRAVQRVIAKEVALELCSGLAREGVEQWHFYTLNIPSLTLEICQALQQASPSVDWQAVA